MHRLALGLGMTIAELGARMGATELERWMEFWRVEPWGPYRDNIHAGLIAAAVLQPHVPRGKRSPTHADFMLKDAQETRASAEKSLLSFFKMAAVKKRKA